MNPPYGRTVGKWIEKAKISAEENGATVVCLLPVRTDTVWWHDHIAEGKAETRFLKGRIKLGDQENSAPFPSVIVVFHGNPLRCKENMSTRKHTPLPKVDGDIDVATDATALVSVAGKASILDTRENGSGFHLSPIIMSGGESAAWRFLEFFTFTIRNVHTRRAYMRVASSLLGFCEERGVMDLKQIQPMMIAAFIETRTNEMSAPTRRDSAALRLPGDRAHRRGEPGVRGPRYSVKTGKTPVLSREDAKHLLESIPIIYKDKNGKEQPHVVGLRDRALIGLMVFSFARVGAVTKVKVGDYYQNGKRWKVRLHEKGGKFHELPVHHKVEEYIDAYLDVAGIREGRRAPLFRTTLGRTLELTDRRRPTCSTW